MHAFDFFSSYSGYPKVALYSRIHYLPSKNGFSCAMISDASLRQIVESILDFPLLSRVEFAQIPPPPCPGAKHVSRNLVRKYLIHSTRREQLLLCWRMR